MSKSIGSYVRQQHLALAALFLVIAGGTALAATAPKNSVKSKSVKNEALKSQDLKDGKAVAGADVVDDSLKGADVDESTLELAQAQVPQSLPPSGAAGGSLAGRYPNPGLAPASVGPNELANDSVGAAKVSAGAIGADELAPNAVGSIAVEDGQLNGGDVADDSLTGNDVSESSLGQVPSARLGGIGRTFESGTVCDPESTAFTTCGFTTLSLPAPSRVLLVGSIRGETEEDSDSGVGSCRLGTNIGGTMASPDNRIVVNDGNAEFSTLTTVTAPIGPGQVSFGIDCNQIAIGAIRYSDAHISAVALSAS